AGTLLDVQGTYNAPARLNVGGGAKNAGTIGLQIFGDFSASTLAVTDTGAFTNAASGVIRTQRIGGSDNFAITGDLANAGTLAVNDNISLRITGNSLTNQPSGMITGSGIIDLSGSGGAPLTNFGTVQV